MKLGSFTFADWTLEVPVIKRVYHKDFAYKTYKNDIGLMKLDSYALEKQYHNGNNGHLKDGM